MIAKIKKKIKGLKPEFGKGEPKPGPKSGPKGGKGGKGGIENHMNLDLSRNLNLNVNVLKKKRNLKKVKMVVSKVDMQEEMVRWKCEQSQKQRWEVLI